MNAEHGIFYCRSGIYRVWNIRSLSIDYPAPDLVFSAYTGRGYTVPHEKQGVAKIELMFREKIPDWVPTVLGMEKIEALVLKIPSTTYVFKGIYLQDTGTVTPVKAYETKVHP